MGAEYESDDERYENNGVIETVNNISKVIQIENTDI